MQPPLCRRRFLSIAACAISVPGRARASTASWRGSALGAAASITLGGTGRAAAGATFASVEAELERLEDIFSLYRETSSLSVLNRDGVLNDPPGYLVEVLALAGEIHAATNGAFDPTVQPLWRVLAEAPEGSAPDDAAVRLALQCIGWDRVEMSQGRIAFTRPGMAITLNGIAQGYITDRIAALLRDRGFADVLVDMGEIAALGARDGVPWNADIAAADGRVVRRLTLRDRCLATSATMGTPLDRSRHIGHILDPRPGRPPPGNRLAAVSATRAAIADGLSTACCLLSSREAAAAVASFDGAKLETLQ